ncbi:Prephenate dehydratase [Fulvivirga imtechensis AK7]|uniref:prephenate dehydratase n=1 Tax=Fulvivirga imtechensis AK7 TaxID=1237149 RepID=L8JN37_9BACT|nr:prephenate dehydratase [Fulvivirga imtechensis]ELR69643.1 Prephenate dehydratase [Fulvivirga imtechensis AK7]
MKVAIQGIRGAFHEVAAKKHFDNDISIVECLTFKSLCDALKDGKVDHAVMAIENTIAGSILGNYSLIRDYRFHVIGEVYLNIKMNLLTLPGVALKNIKTVESHPIALQQCKEFLYEQLSHAVLRESNDTAESARDLGISGDTTKAVIAADRCARLYGLEIKRAGIETNKQNFTRFLALSRVPVKDNSNNKASISLQLGHEPGTLADILTIFKANGANLTKIQSVPVIGKPYEYHFHIDFEWEDYSRYEKTMEEVEDKALSLHLLGEYKKAFFGLNE